MASSITIPEAESLIQRVIKQATGATLHKKDINIDKILERPDNTIASIWFHTYSINQGAIIYLIDWDRNMITFDNCRNRELHGEIRFNGRY